MHLLNTVDNMIRLPLSSATVRVCFGVDQRRGVQGVTELTTCERTADEWLRSVQEEFRYGKLTKDTHAFLHGEPTLLPGSVIRNKTMCRSKQCARRCKDMLAVSDVTDLQREVQAA